MYTIERIKERAKEARKEACLLEDARKTERKIFDNELDEVETKETVIKFYLLYNKTETARLCFEKIPGFAPNAAAAMRRARSILETEKSADADRQALFEKYAAMKSAHKRIWFDGVERYIQQLYDKAKRLEKIAESLEEGREERTKKGLPEVDIDTIIVGIKEKYTEERSAKRVAEWAASEGYTRTAWQAQKVVDWALDEMITDDEELENLCADIRTRGRQIAYWYN